MVSMILEGAGKNRYVCTFTPRICHLASDPSGGTDHTQTNSLVVHPDLFFRLAKLHSVL